MLITIFIIIWSLNVSVFNFSRPNASASSTFLLSINYLQMVGVKKYYNDKLVNEEFGIQVRPELTSIEARVLPPPMVYC